MNKVWMFITKHVCEIIGVLFIVFAFVFSMFTVHSCVQDIKEAGGIRTFIVEAGKETKLLAKDIDKAVEKHYESERNIPYR